MQVTPAPDPRLCPLCAQPNRCALACERASGVLRPPCWCTQATFEAELLSRIPEHARGKACICAACARSTVTAPRDRRAAPR